MINFIPIVHILITIADLSTHAKLQTIDTPDFNIYSLPQCSLVVFFKRNYLCLCFCLLIDTHNICGLTLIIHSMVQ